MTTGEMPNLAWALIILGLLLAMSVYGWFFHRARVILILCHNLIWAGALALVGSGLIAYKTSSTQAWLTLASGIVAFNVGIWIVSWIRTARRRSAGVIQRDEARALSDTPPLVSRTTVAVLLIIYSAAFALYVVNIAVRYGLDRFFTDPSSIRGAEGVSYLESLPLPIRLMLYLGPVLFALMGIRSSISRPLPIALRILAMVALAASMLALLQRTNLFMGVLLLLSLLVTNVQLGRKNDGATGVRRSFHRRWRVPIIVGVFGIAALLVFQLLGGALGKTGQQALGTGAVSDVLARSGLTAPVVYYASGSVAFLQLADSHNRDWPPVHKRGEPDLVGGFNPQTWGAVTFAPLMKVLPGVRQWPSNEPFIDTGVRTNVYTWLSPFYRDFRLAGVVVGSLLLGALIGLLHGRRFQSSRMFWLQGVLISGVLLAPFGPKINNTLFLTELTIIIVLTLSKPQQAIRGYIKRRHASRNSEQIAP